jgi:predicted RNA binding protein YcfA (HicA-like mRNA interferase family)
MTQTSQPIRLTSAFDSYSAELIRDMESDGWSGKISKRGHAILRAPDGVTSCTVAPKSGAPQDRLNQGAVYRAWKKAQDAPSGQIIQKDPPARPRPSSQLARENAELRQEVAALRAENAELRQENQTWQELVQETEEAYLAALAHAEL